MSQFENIWLQIYLQQFCIISVSMYWYMYFFPALKKKYDDAESACHLIKHDLESAKKDLCRVKEDVKWYVHRIKIVPALTI